MTNDRALEARASDSEHAKCHSNLWKAIKKLHGYYSMGNLIDCILAVADEWLAGYETDLFEANSEAKSKEIASMRGSIEGVRARFASVRAA